MHLEISKVMLISHLISNLPNVDAISSNGEIAVLRREMAKQRKLMPTRKLISELPNLLPALKPCLMMSPLSVSTFLGNSNYEFDTVIFDEASQVRTEDAIGAIFRAKQAIIAGDSKQLPPTDFFSSYMSVSDEFEEDEDGEFNDTGAYESLLDEAMLLPTQTLLWHYRSRHEHLITFSNAKIYNGNLITFPSSVEKKEDMGVEYVYVPKGVYSRGKNGNKAEAAKVAEMVFEHFKEHPERSLGIIAFGEVQQSAIQDALIVKRQANRNFETFFKDNNEEPVFIKNLETVQGDERDTIIFSIGYAPDSSGKFIMNFGPLSREGGERRLNVAVTRARYNLKLVGSIMPTSIDVEKISKEGPKLLRLYIDFAMNGPKAILREITTKDDLCFESDFEISVHKFLTDNGYDVATQVGCSGYRIDMAVRHPKYNGCFAIGIECDGAMYHSARTARERDRLRQTILEDMGWVIYRIWSTDWIKNRSTEGDRLLAAVQNAIDNYKISVPPPSQPSTNQPSSKMTDYMDVSEKTEAERIHDSTEEKIQKLRSSGYYKDRIDNIPTDDIGAVMLKVIDMNYGLNKADLFKETALYGYGWERQGNKIKQQFEKVFASLIRKKKVEMDSDGKLQVAKISIQ
jgi:very-short-patch-repair endonuclease